jgi:hypothetical protein
VPIAPAAVLASLVANNPSTHTHYAHRTHNVHVTVFSVVSNICVRVHRRSRTGNDRQGGGRRDGGAFGADRYDSSGDNSNWRELAKKAAEERAAAAPVERERDREREPRRDDRPDRRDRRDDRYASLPLRMCVLVRCLFVSWRAHMMVFQGLRRACIRSLSLKIFIQC